MSLLFWFCLIVLGYTYAGYPALLWGLVARKRRKPAVKSATATAFPPVSYVLVVCNEAGRIVERIDNLAQCDYPGERELIVVCGGCTDDSAERARARTWPGMTVRVIEQAERRGKAAGLNAGVAASRGEIVVFADARQRFNRHAVRLLVAAFADPAVGAVSGNLEIAASETGAGAGIDAYWKLERLIRRLESDWDSAIGCTGAIYAMRRELFEPLPEDTLLDDVVIPMRVLAAGRRVLFEREATAFDPQELAPELEKRRKIRTLAGNYQMLFRYPQWMVPWRCRAWWQVISHKYLRLAGPFLLAGCLVSAALAAGGSWFFRASLAVQVFCYALAFLGMIFRGVKTPLLTAPAGFVFLQWQSLRALVYYLRRLGSRDGGVW